jgi:hypothetical protein
MWSKLTYTKKCYALIAGLLIFFYVGYKMSFNDTLVLKEEISSKQEKLLWLKQKERELPALKAKMFEFEKAYAKNDSLSARDKLTSYISEFAEDNDCLVTEIPINSSFKNNNLRVQTNTFTVKGSFNKLLVLLNTLETKHKYLARVMSAQFYTVTDMRLKKRNLYLTIIAQSFEQGSS